VIMINRESINATTMTSAAAIALAAIVLLSTGWSAFSAIFIRTNGANDPSDGIARLIAEYEKDIELYQARFNGRSAFFRPPARPAPAPPPPPPPPVEEEEEEEVEEVEPPPPPPPPVPSEYDGPPVLYVLGDMVVFRSGTPGEPGKRIRVGQVRDGIDIVSVSPPRSVRLGYQPDGYERGEFDVPIFDWSMPGLGGDEVSRGGALPGLIAVDGTTDFRTQELYERMAGGADPSQAGSRAVPSRTTPRPPSGRETTTPPRGRATPQPPSRGRGR
jgi:hypothetical protein